MKKIVKLLAFFLALSAMISVTAVLAEGYRFANLADNCQLSIAINDFNGPNFNCRNNVATVEQNGGPVLKMPCQMFLGANENDLSKNDDPAIFANGGTVLKMPHARFLMVNVTTDSTNSHSTKGGLVVKIPLSSNPSKLRLCSGSRDVIHG